MGRLVLTHSTYIKGLVALLKKLVVLEGIQTITPGVITRGKGKSESLVIRVTRKTLSGYKLVARKGKEAQEIYIITKMDEELLKKSILKVENKTKRVYEQD